MPEAAPRWWRSPMVALSWQLPLVTTILLVSVLLPTYGLAVRALNLEVRAAIEEELLGLDEAYRDDGLPGLVIDIRARTRGSADRSAIYLLVDAAGTPMAGNLDQWPEGVSQRDMKWFAIPTGGSDSIEGKTVALPDGSRLLVGRPSPMKRLLQSLQWRLTLAGVLVLIATTALGLWTLSRYRARLRRMQDAAGGILAGDVWRRLEVSRRRDEFDHLAERFNTAFAAIERSVDAARHVSSVIAHDMRRPIAAVRYRLEELAQRPGLDAATQADVERLLVEIDETLGTFSALLRLARLESGGYGPRHEAVDLVALLNDAVETYAPVAETRQLPITLSTVPASIHGDRDLLFQAVQNLIENAIKYGGQHIEVNLRCSDGEVMIAVRDFGAGVAAEALPHLFERFFRADSARGGSGSGIGLALVRAVAEVHGGRAEVHNAEPGLCVEIILPERAHDAVAGMA